MTELLKQAIAEIEKMPADVQDAIAARLLAELADEKAWQERFAMTTAEQWDRMAEIARQEIEAGDTFPLEEILLLSEGRDHETHI